MEKLTKCKACGADVAKSAKTCPQCGAKLKHGHPILGGILIAIGIITFLGAFNGSKAGDSAVSTAPDSTVTLAEFEKIESGMTYDEVVSIVGFDGTLNSQVDMNMGDEYKTEIYSWVNPFGTNMNATFQGGKLVTKSQVGLK